jgi:hypothetical protein
MQLHESDVAEGDLEFIAQNLRPSDSEEMAAYGHANPLPALISAASVTGRVHVLRDPHGRPVCLYGLHRTGQGFNSPWMLGTTLIFTNRRDFWLHSQRVIREFDAEGLPMLNHVHRENMPARFWLQRLGFEIHYDEPVTTATGGVFYPFERIPNVRTH